MARESEPVPSILVTSPLEEFQSTVIPSILVTSPLEEFQSSHLPSILISRELHPEDEEEDTSSNHFRYWFLGESTRETERSSIVFPLYKECHYGRITHSTIDLMYTVCYATHAYTTTVYVRTNPPPSRSRSYIP
jgi:hypothetical protein